MDYQLGAWDPTPKQPLYHCVHWFNCRFASVKSIIKLKGTINRLYY